MARELIRHGGSAIQAETDELMGAEKYFLRPAEILVLPKFLKMITDSRRDWNLTVRMQKETRVVEISIEDCTI